MPRGLNIATCRHCGRQWVVGDCIPATCDECYAEGHRDAAACPRCQADLVSFLAEAARARNEREKAEQRQAEDEDFSRGIL